MILNNRLFILLIIISNTITPEFILYKKDAEKIAPLNYKNMSDNEKTELIELYEKTIIRYQWPTVLKYYSNFSHKEKQDYLHACSIKKGLSDFITKKVESLSKNKYSSAWIPTTIFELKTLSYCVQHMTENVVNQQLQHLKNQEKQAALQAFFVQNYVFNIFDELLNTYQQQGIFVTQYSGNEPFVDKFIKEIVPNLTNNTSFGQDLRIITHTPQQISELTNNPLYKNLKSLNFSIYEDEWLNIIKKYLKAEEEAFFNNQFTLLRGTNGYTINPHNRPTAYNPNIDQQDYIDFQLGGTNGISYGYSLFAGTVLERFYQQQFSNIKEPRGARALDYIVNSDIGYYVTLNIKDFQSLQQVFSLPGLSTFESLFGRGEEFHPRLKTNTDFLSEQQKNIRAQMLAQLLRNAKFIKIVEIYPYRNEKILANDILLQQAEILYGQKQGRFKIMHAEDLAFYNNIIVPLIDSGKPLPQITVPYFKYLNSQALQKLTKTQLESFSAEQVNALTATQLQQLKPDQLKILLTPEKIGSLTSIIFDAQIISTLTKDQLEAIRPKQIEEFNQEQFKLFSNDQLMILASPRHISLLHPYTLFSFPVSDFNQLQTQALPMHSIMWFKSVLDKINTEYLSPQQVQTLGKNIVDLRDAQIYNLPADAIQTLTTDILGLAIRDQELIEPNQNLSVLVTRNTHLSEQIAQMKAQIEAAQDATVQEQLTQEKNNLLTKQQELSSEITDLQQHIANKTRYVINCVDIAKLSIQQIENFNSYLAQRINDNTVSQFTLKQFKTIIALPDQEVFRECIKNNNRQTVFLSPDRICLLSGEQSKEINHAWLTKEQVKALSSCEKT